MKKVCLGELSLTTEYHIILLPNAFQNSLFKRQGHFPLNFVFVFFHEASKNSQFNRLPIRSIFYAAWPAAYQRSIYIQLSCVHTDPCNQLKAVVWRLETISALGGSLSCWCSLNTTGQIVDKEPRVCRPCCWKHGSSFNKGNLSYLQNPDSFLNAII